MATKSGYDRSAVHSFLFKFKGASVTVKATSLYDAHRKAVRRFAPRPSEAHLVNGRVLLKEY